ncbi:MAG: hypothetical protein JNM27_13565 [Leptospirales bacterium]|nr:hypothetical protein [Leptospirales bacterium]
MMTSRFLAVFPLFFFLLKVYQYRASTDQGQILWWCNISNLLLGLAILAGNARGVWLASFMLILGTPIWLLDVWATGDFTIYSVFTHIISPGMGIYCVRRLAVTRGIWWQSMLYYFSLMLLSRMLTAPALNVNLAHDIYASAKPFIQNYWLYTAMNSSLLAVSLFITEKLASRWFPVSS